MTDHSTPPERRVAATAAAVAGLATAVLGLTVLTGWHLGEAALVQVRPTFVPMQYNTALGFLFCGTALLAVRFGRPAWTAAAGGLALLTGALTGAQYVTGVDLGIDELFMEHAITLATSHPGRMAPNSALCFVLAGAALLAVGPLAARPRAPAAAGLTGLLVAGLGAVALGGYAAGVEGAYGWGSLTRMAVHTSIGFMVVGGGIAALAWDHGRRDAASPSWLPAGAGVATTALTVILWQAAVALDRVEVERTVETNAKTAAARVESLVERKQEALARMAGRLATKAGRAGEVWERDATLYLAHEPAYRAIQLVDAGDRIRWVVPLAGNEAMLGRDLAADPVRREALGRARERYTPTVSGVVDLAGDERGFLVLAPIRDGARLHGYVVGVLRARILLDRVLAKHYAPDFAYAVMEGDREVDAHRPADGVYQDAMSREWPVRFGTTGWRIRLWPREGYLAQFGSRLSTVLLVSGILLSVLLAFSLYLVLRTGRARAQVERLQRRVALILDSAGEGIYGLDLQGRTTFANRAAGEMVGRDPETVVGRSRHDLFHHSRPDGAPYPREECPIEASLRDGIVHRVDTEVFWHADGSSFPVEYTSTPIVEDGARTGAVVVFRDVTARKQADEELKRARSTLEQRVEERTAELQDLNDSLRGEIAQRERTEQALKETAESLRERDWFRTGQSELHEQVRGELAMTELAARVVSHLCRFLEVPMGAIYERGDGDVLQLTGSYAFKARRSWSGQVRLGEGLVGQCALEGKPILLADVPEDYIAIGSGLGEATPRHVLVVPCLHDGAVVAVVELASARELDGTRVAFVEQVAESIAIAVHTVRTRERMADLLAESQRQAEELQAQQEELRATNEQLGEQAERLRQSEGELTAQSEELRATNEQLEEKSSNLDRQKRDIEAKNRELRRAQADLEAKAEALAASSHYKSEFLANMSHELRTPLNSLLILAKSLTDNDEGNLTDEQIECARIIHGSGCELVALINDILDLSKVEAGKLRIETEAVEIEDLCRELARQFEPMAREKGLELRFERDPEAPEVIATDGQRLGQVLRNLLSNALKFSDRGQVEVTVRRHDEPIAGGGAVAFAVRDTGPGIEASKRQAIFEAFQQGDGSTSRRHGGTGLGLSISRELARLLGGEIRLESQVGEGSTFTLLLPADPVAAPVAAPVPRAPAGDAGTADSGGVAGSGPDAPQDGPEDGPDILIIEDDDRFAGVLARLVQKQRYRCRVARTGREGLALAERLRPGGIVLDLGLPDLDGTNVLERLKENPATSDIPVHVVSGRDDLSLDPVEAGAVGYLPKPATESDIGAMLERLGRGPGRGPKRVLVVEDDAANREAIVGMVDGCQVEAVAVDSGAAACAALDEGEFDCVILDLELPDMSGLEVLETASRDRPAGLPPVVVHTGRDLDREEHAALRRYAESVVVKGAHAPERLLDEVSLFLHRVRGGLAPKPRELAAAEHDGEDVLRGQRVLLVDDDLRNTFALTKVLRRHGLEVEIADNGELALEKLEQQDDIRLVLMDVMMPVMDGLEATRAIRRNPDRKRLPIIALTAKAMKEDRGQCIAAGANDYITKPVDVERLLSMMRVWLYDSAAVERRGPDRPWALDNTVDSGTGAARRG